MRKYLNIFFIFSLSSVCCYSQDDSNNLDIARKLICKVVVSGSIDNLINDCRINEGVFKIVLLHLLEPSDLTDIQGYRVLDMGYIVSYGCDWVQFYNLIVRNNKAEIDFTIGSWEYGGSQHRDTRTAKFYGRVYFELRSGEWEIKSNFISMDYLDLPRKLN